MKAMNVLYGGRLDSFAFEKVLPAGGGRKSAFELAVAASTCFPGVEKTVVLGIEGADLPLPRGVEAELRPSWTRKSLLEEISRLGAGFDLSYFSWADCPLLDASLAGAVAGRHLKYSAEYSYADGWPYGFAPEVLAPGTAGILAKIAEADDGPVERSTLFDVLQKDINAFDIETEIAPFDLRLYRLCFAADCKRNLLLLSRFTEAGYSRAGDAEKCVAERPEILRTLPSFFAVQVTDSCPQRCSLCPWPRYCPGASPALKGFMPVPDFASLLDKIAAFAGDAVVDLSLWGELALHPDARALAEAVLERPGLSLVVETSGIGWKRGDLEAIAGAAARAPARENNMAAVSWVVSLDAFDEARYRELRGAGFAEAVSTAKTLLALFPKDAYVQAVRVKDGEDDIEKFYRFWKAESLGRPDGSHIIIQKYDDFAGALQKRQASDLSPVKRRPCWHITRDMNVLLDGSVPRCREDLAALSGGGVLGNAFTDDLGAVWESGRGLYMEHCGGLYPGICAGCDEYYTFNF